MKRGTMFAGYSDKRMADSNFPRVFLRDLKNSYPRICQKARKISFLKIFQADFQAASPEGSQKGSKFPRALARHSKWRRLVILFPKALAISAKSAAASQLESRG